MKRKAEEGLFFPVVSLEEQARRQLATQQRDDVLRKIVLNTPTHNIPFELPMAQLASVAVTGRVPDPNFVLNRYTGVVSPPIPELGDMTGRLVSYDPDSGMVAISVNHTTRPDFWLRIMFNIRDIEEWDHTGGDMLQLQGQSRYGFTVINAYNYDEANRIMYIRADTPQRPEFWAELTLNLDNLEQWLGHYMIQE